jgi:hypothetical protein
MWGFLGKYEVGVLDLNWSAPPAEFSVRCSMYKNGMHSAHLRHNSCHRALLRACHTENTCIHPWVMHPMTLSLSSTMCSSGCRR